MALTLPIRNNLWVHNEWGKTPGAQTAHTRKRTRRVSNSASEAELPTSQSPDSTAQPASAATRRRQLRQAEESLNRRTLHVNTPPIDQYKEPVPTRGAREGAARSNRPLTSSELDDLKRQRDPRPETSSTGETTRSRRRQPATASTPTTVPPPYQAPPSPSPRRRRTTYEQLNSTESEHLYQSDDQPRRSRAQETARRRELAELRQAQRDSEDAQRAAHEAQLAQAHEERMRRERERERELKAQKEAQQKQRALEGALLREIAEQKQAQLAAIEAEKTRQEQERRSRERLAQREMELLTRQREEKQIKEREEQKANARKARRDQAAALQEQRMLQDRLALTETGISRPLESHPAPLGQTFSSAHTPDTSAITTAYTPSSAKRVPPVPITDLGNTADESTPKPAASRSPAISPKQRVGSAHSQKATVAAPHQDFAPPPKQTATSAHESSAGENAQTNYEVPFQRVSALARQGAPASRSQKSGSSITVTQSGSKLSALSTTSQFPTVKATSGTHDEEKATLQQKRSRRRHTLTAIGVLLAAALVIAVGTYTLLRGAVAAPATTSAVTTKPTNTKSALPNLATSAAATSTEDTAKPPASDVGGILAGKPIPTKGTGETTIVPGNLAAPASANQTVTLRVEVEGGLPVDGKKFATAVFKTLNDPRGWGGDGRYSFARTDNPENPARLVLASPTLVDKLCAPLDTEGFTSCRNGNNIVINIQRWAAASEPFMSAGGNLEQYRNYVVSHEVGHYLGNRHSFCPGPGKLAPVMHPQTSGTAGCKVNPWINPDKKS